MKKRFIGLYLLCCVLLVGCAAGMHADTPAKSESAPAAESQSVDSAPEKTPASQLTGGGREDILPERKPVNKEKDDAAKPEEHLTEEEKARLRFEKGTKFALGEDEGSFVGSIAYVYTADGVPLRQYDGQKEMQEDGLELWLFSSYDSAVEADKKGFVLVMNESVPQDAFYYNRSEIYCAEWAEMGGEEPPEDLIRSYRKWDAATQTYTRFFDRSDFEMTVDLAARKVSGEYRIQPGNVEWVLVHSPCGRYDICEAGRTSAGDSSSSSIVLRDNATGQFRWLSRRRSHYSDYGFFANGDLYVREPDCLRMFYKESGYTKQAPFELPLGIQPEGFTRYLSAVRRDPVDGTYLVVYYEETDQQAQDRWMNPEQTDVCFTLGKCDRNGSLLQSWNSGQTVVSPLYDTSWVDLWLRDGVMYVNAYVKSYQTPVREFSFDLQTKTFNDLKQAPVEPGPFSGSFGGRPTYSLGGTIRAAWDEYEGVDIQFDKSFEINHWNNSLTVRSGGSAAVIAESYSKLNGSVGGLRCVALLRHADGTLAAAVSEKNCMPDRGLCTSSGNADATDNYWLDASALRLYWQCEHAGVQVVADFNTGTITSQPYSR